MTCFRVTAPSSRGKIGKGFQFMVNSCNYGSAPMASEIEEALIKLGYPEEARSWRSAGNWICEKM